MSSASIKPVNKVFIKPTAGRVLVERDGFHYSGKLVIPDRAKQRPTTGTVVAVGEGCEDWLGKRVVFPMFSGTDYKFKGFPAWTMLQVEELHGEILKTDQELELVELQEM